LNENLHKYFTHSGRELIGFEDLGCKGQGHRTFSGGGWHTPLIDGSPLHYITGTLEN